MLAEQRHEMHWFERGCEVKGLDVVFYCFLAARARPSLGVGDGKHALLPASWSGWFKQGKVVI